jgi:nicotinamide-nucleotide amidase
VRARRKGRIAVRRWYRARWPLLGTSLRYARIVAGSRSIRSAELLSIGSELTVGETRDTNAGDLARTLTERGIRVTRIQALPDELDVVTDAFSAALARVDLVVSTGGLGPTPDDLTREAIAAAVGEEPAVDPDLEVWLRSLWSRRGLPMPDLNLKQAWLIPSAHALANDAGTAPGWWIDRPDGRVIVALPGPPREMRPIWTNDVLPRLADRGAGRPVAQRTFRLAGIGESAVAELLGEEMLRARDPVVATYARSDAVDVRVSAFADGPGLTADARIAEASARIRSLLADHIWAEGDTTWADAIGTELARHGWTLAILEIGTGGSLATLLGDRDYVRFAESTAFDAPAVAAHDDPDGENDPTTPLGLEALARRAGELGRAEVSIGVRVRERNGDTAVTVVVISPDRVHQERRLAFLGGAAGRSRAALVAAAALLFELRRVAAAGASDAKAVALDRAERASAT